MSRNLTCYSIQNGVARGSLYVLLLLAMVAHAIRWNGVVEDVNRSTVNGVQCLSEISCVRRLFGKVCRVLDVV